jgi:mannose-6-phosphate isomerase-like protein (cupin superfamily)
VTITLPVGSKVRTGLHWHEQYTEYLAVVQGVALVTLDDKTERFGPLDGVIVIPRYTKHEYRRADTETGTSGEDGWEIDLILKE